MQNLVHPFSNENLKDTKKLMQNHQQLIKIQKANFHR